MLKFLKSFFFLEVAPIIKLGRNKVLVETDMLPIPDDLNAKKSNLNINELNFKSPVKLLFSSIWYTRKKIIPAYIWYLFSTIMSLLSPILIHRFIASISHGVNDDNFKNVILTGLVLAIFGMFSGQFVQQFFVRALSSYQQMTNVLNELIFKHSLKLSLSARSKNMVGDIVNYMGTDSESVSDFTFVFGDGLMNIILAIGAIVMLFQYIGISALTALIVMLLMVPLTKKIASKFIHLEDEMMSLRDKRVTLMGQVLNSIRVVKFYAWESSIEQEVMEVRNTELDTRIRLGRSQVMSGVTYSATSTIVLFVALFTHSLRGQNLDAALIFTCVSLFGILEGPIGELSHLLSRGSSSFIGAKRILKFLSEEEVIKENIISTQNTYGLNVHSFSASYDYKSDLVLKDISFSLSKGKSLAIVGGVGSGKSSLLYGILNELKTKNGDIEFEGLLKNERPKIAYLPQEAYIVNESLKENILFGEEFNEARFNKALYNSALVEDLNHFKFGIDTEIGEKGVNLSGGQKQRVGLARAYISNPQFILLDDPLSAVDGTTEDILIERLIFGEWSQITRVIATHRLAHLSKFDQIIYLKEGKIESIGNLKTLLETSSEFKSFYQNHEQNLHSNEEIAQESENSAQNDTNVNNISNKNDNRITEDEDREVGAVKKTIYIDYIKSLGGDNLKLRPYILSLLFIGAIVIAFLPLVQKSWLSYFSSHQNIWDSKTGVAIYGILGLLVILLSMLNSFFWLHRGVTASKILHDKMLRSVLKAPIRFFDSTPVGRILQRFSRDVESVDIYLQWSFISFISCVLQVIVSLVLIITIMPFILIVIFPLLIVYYIVQRDYRRSAREAKRFDSISRSPRYAHFKETLQGLLVIRSFNKEEWFIESFYNKLIESQRMFYSHYMLNRWFSSRIPLIGGCISFATVAGISIMAKKGMIDAGVAGLVTIYSLSFWSYLNWAIRVFSDIESRMTSVERLKFFSTLIPEEHPDFIEIENIEDSWPLHGKINISGIKVRYAPHLPLVLKGISFDIVGGSKVGIMGRTGSGKSTFFQALFRFIEIEVGSILIDDVNIQKVTLSRLRSAMAIIPQDPTLFMGTIRSNLDRYSQYSDLEIDNVLTQTGLIEFINSLSKGVHSEVLESGSNLSQGQRQLLCMARALLTKAKIIVMDEATASVDVKTDNMIQKVIRSELKNVTLIIIAHRLSTIKDCDQIIEIRDGQIVS